MHIHLSYEYKYDFESICCFFMYLSTYLSVISVGGPKDHLTFHDSIGGLRAFSIYGLHSWIYYSGGYKAKSAKKKTHGVNSRGHLSQISKNPLPVESHRMHLFFPKMSCDNTCEILSTKEIQ